MKDSGSLRVIFASFFQSGLRAKRTRVFMLLSAVPVLIMVIVRIVDAKISGEFFTRVALSLYFQLLLPVLALFLGSSVVNEELDGKTLVYLTTVPVRRRDVLLGKFAAALALGALMLAAGFLLGFLAAFLTRLDDPAAWGDLGVFLGAALLALFCYGALFTAAGAFMRKSIIAGLFFAFGWESVVQYFPGVTQKFTVVHWVKSLLPIPPGEGGFLIFQLQPSPPLQSVFTLLAAGFLFLGLAVLIFERKEYILSDNV
jgi:ABC-2 type transport system permease protein